MPNSTPPLSLSIKIRSSIYNALFPVWTVLVCSSCLPALYLARRSHHIAFSGQIWAKGILFMLKHLCGVTFKIEGTEHLPKDNTPFVVACRHESVWETCVFLHLMNHPSYILKKELLSVPLFGSYLKGLKMISIDRTAGSSAIRDMQKQTKACIEEGRNIIIFPEGTRIPHEKRSSTIQPGIAFLYASLPDNIDVIPAALNSGKFWSPFSKIVKPGVITLRYLPPLPKGLARKPMLESLDNAIKSACTALDRQIEHKNDAS